MSADQPPQHSARVHVRPATNDDYDALCPLFAELDLFHRLARPDFFQAAPEPVRGREFIATLIAGPGTAILVADHAGPLSGLAIVRLHEMAGLPIVIPRRMVIVDAIVVAQAWRRRGVGRAILDGAGTWAKANNAAYVEIAVHEFNQGAIRFYEALGYRTSTRRLISHLAD
jgi:diamine N-acetyltransferase